MKVLRGRAVDIMTYFVINSRVLSKKNDFTWSTCQKRIIHHYWFCLLAEEKAYLSCDKFLSFIIR